MPEKFKPSHSIKDKATGKTKEVHFYLKQTPKEELIEYLNSLSSKPKIKNKVRRELVRRGIKIIYQ